MDSDDDSEEHIEYLNQPHMKQNMQMERKALWLSMSGGIFFVVLELIMAVFTGSQAVLMDGAYDAAELLMIFISLKLLPFLYVPLTEKRPFGYSQVESLFIVIKGFMLVAVTVGLVVNNIQIMLEGGREVAFTAVALFQLFSACVGVIVLFLLKRANSTLESPMLEAEINSWLVDTIGSAGMSFAFFLPVLVRAPWMGFAAPYLDQVVAIVLSVFILPVPLKTIRTGLRDLFLLAPEQEEVDEIKEIAERIMEKDEFSDQFKLVTYDIVRTGRRYWVAIYVTPKRDTISISRWSEIQEEIENALVEEYHDVYVELLPEIE